MYFNDVFYLIDIILCITFAILIVITEAFLSCICIIKPSFKDVYADKK